jgi:hypothetical protein
MVGDIREHIKKLSPLMAEDSEIFRELAHFFGDGAKIETNRNDLAKFLGRKRLYRIIRIAGASYKDCAYQLIDNYPEAMESLGMLRYYKAPSAPIQWEEIEKAEIALGGELTMNAYGWMPDAWTAFENRDPVVDAENPYGLVALLAFGYDD